jgi:hypothetical protein
MTKTPARRLRELTLELNRLRIERQQLDEAERALLANLTALSIELEDARPAAARFRPLLVESRQVS